MWSYKSLSRRLLLLGVRSFAAAQGGSDGSSLDPLQYVDTLIGSSQGGLSARSHISVQT